VLFTVWALSEAASNYVFYHRRIAHSWCYQCVT